MSKDAIEKAVRESGVRYWTIIRPGFFMSNFLRPTSAYMFPELASKGVLKSAYEKQTRLALLDSGDVGSVVVTVFVEPERWAEREMDVAAEEVSVDEVVRILGEVIGKKVRIEGYEKSELVRLEEENPMVTSQVLTVKLDADKEGRFKADLEAMNEFGVKMTTFREFLQRSKQIGVLQNDIGGPLI